MEYSTLVSLAFLKVNWDSNHLGYLDNFLPILYESIRIQEKLEISAPDLQTTINQNFGLSIPIHVIRTMLIRAHKKGMVEKRDRIFYKNPEKIDDLTFQLNQSRVEVIYKNVIDRLCLFAEVEYAIKLTKQKAEELIIAFIAYNKFDINNFSEESIVPMPRRLEKKEKFLISDYIAKVVRIDPQLREYFQTLVIGYLLANSLFLPDPNQLQAKFNRLWVYFDTPLLMYALGYDGKDFQDPVRELLELLYMFGARLCCFKHTVEEIRGILVGCSQNRENQNFYRTRYSTQISLLRCSSSDLLLESENIEKRLESIRIKVVDRPIFVQENENVDEVELRDAVNNKVRYTRDAALDKDINSILSIYRIRAGRMTSRLEDSRAIFVTTNSSLCNAVNGLFYDHLGRDLVPPCIHDFSLTTLVWLKTPLKFPELPLARIIADSYAAIQPSPAFLARWMSEIDKLAQKENIDKDDYYFMKYSTEVHTALMETTCGDEQVELEGKVPQIIERAKQKIVEETKNDFEEEIDKISRSNVKLSDELAETKSKDLLRLQRIDNEAYKRGKFCRNVFSFIRFIFSLTLIGTSFIGFSIKEAFTNKQIGLIILGVVLLIFQILDKFCDLGFISVISVERKIELYFANKLKAKLQNLLE